MALSARGTIVGAVAAVLVAACAPQARIAEHRPAPVPPEPKAMAALPAPAIAPKVLTLEGYKTLIAHEVWLRNATVYSDPVPEMLKSIVVLEITIDRVGNPIDVYVVRSNGFKHLESRALESVVRAAPFPVPPATVLEDSGEVTFLETFLFRGDDAFQLRTLVGPPGL